MSDDARRLARRIVDEIEARAAATRSATPGSRPIPQGAAPAAPEPDTPAQQAARRIVAEVFDHWRPDASEDGPPTPPERTVERPTIAEGALPDADPRGAEPPSPTEPDAPTVPAERPWEPEDLFPVDDPVDAGPSAGIPAAGIPAADSPAVEVTSGVGEAEPGLEGVEPEPRLNGAETRPVLEDAEPEPGPDGAGPEADVADVEPVMDLPRVDGAGDLPDVEPAGDLPDVSPVDEAAEEPGTESDEVEPDMEPDEAEVTVVLDADRRRDDTSAAVGPPDGESDRHSSAGADPVAHSDPRLETGPRVEPRALASEESEPTTVSRTGGAGSPMPTPSDEPGVHDVSSPSSLAARIVAEVFETQPVHAGATAVVGPARPAASSAQVRPGGEDAQEGGGSDTGTPADAARSGRSADHTQEPAAEGDEEVDLLEVVDLTEDLAAVAPRDDDTGRTSPSRRDDDPPSRGHAPDTLDEGPTTSGRNGQRAEGTETLAVRERTDLAGSEAADAVSDAPEDAAGVGERAEGPGVGDSSDQGPAAAQTELPEAEPEAERPTGAEQLDDEELLLDVEPEPRRTGRWLLMTVLGAVGLALLFPLAVSALRELVAAGGG